MLSRQLAYYQQRRFELGYDIQENEDYPHIQTVADIIPMITLDSMIIPYGYLHPERNVGLLFHCTIIRNDT
ncbi:DUF6985 domain-containing protein [Paenibacillus kandeliae]|uniref:DUF6985 domain-containing protein n=1 Tax=Paenibacillus kandeliae TaxID=3231269 RepID=UPI003F5381A8